MFLVLPFAAFALFAAGSVSADTSACECADAIALAGEPACAIQFVLVGTVLETFAPRCPDPATPDDDLVTIEDFSRSVVTFAVENVLKTSQLDEAPVIVAGDVVQIFTASGTGPDTCGFPMEEGLAYLISGFEEDLQGCTVQRDQQIDPRSRLVNIGTTVCDDNVAQPSDDDIQQRAQECASEFGPVDPAISPALIPATASAAPPEPSEVDAAAAAPALAPFGSSALASAPSPASMPTSTSAGSPSPAVVSGAQAGSGGGSAEAPAPAVVATDSGTDRSASAAAASAPAGTDPASGAVTFPVAAMTSACVVVAALL